MNPRLLRPTLALILLFLGGCSGESEDTDVEAPQTSAEWLDRERAAGLSSQGKGFPTPAQLQERESRSGKDRPNVLMIALDNVRADRLSSYGGPNPTTPVLDALASRGTRFEHCISQAPYTPHSFSSLMSGLYVADLPVRTRSVRPEPLVHAGLESFHVTIPEALQSQGYVTHGILSGWFTDAFGLRQGFDTVTPGKRTTTQVVDEARTFLEGWRDAGAEDPFFLFAYSLDVHAEFMSDMPDHENVFGGDPEGLRYARDQMKRITNNEYEPTQADLDNAVTLYDEGLYWTDHALGRLIETLDEMELADDTIVLLVSDHGEEFREHGYYGHAQTNYAQVIDVPLIIYDPRAPGPAVVEDRVMNLDVLPTVLDLVGAPIPAAARGLSLAPSIYGENQPELSARPLFSEGAPNGYVGAVIAGDFKLLLLRAGQRELYEIATDPDETRDLADQHPRMADQFERMLWTHKRDGLAHQILLAFDPSLTLGKMSLPRVDLSSLAGDTAGESEMSEETLEELRTLGYLD